tara:strand:- start:298 stop:846 length:549 start_codon:yes stop_codon:yes gene_type:complete
MTPRLKILIVGLILSLIYAISDYIIRNRDKPVVEVKREVKERPKTARVDLNRIATIRAKAAKIAKAGERRSGIIPRTDFKPISDEILALEGWGRDPFIAVKEKPMALPQEAIKEFVQERAISDLDDLRIESVAKLGEKVFVIINGQRFREGDRINNLLIESIKNQKITFLMGKTRIIKVVGT